MINFSGIFGRSPFEPLIEHARKVHECVALVRPAAEAIVAGDSQRLDELQHEVSKTEYEADQIKDRIRERLPRRYFLSVNREDVAGFLRDVDKIADAAEDFLVAATFRTVHLPQELYADFLGLVDKVVLISETLLGVAEHLSQLQKEAFVGAEAEDVLDKIQEVCHMEWESDKLSRKLARHYYTALQDRPVDIMVLDKLCRSLTGIADHAENVGKSLRLMISRK